MQITPKWLPVGGLVTGLVLSTAVIGFGQSPPSAPKRDPERHPHIRAAMTDLRKAANQLERADHDFGGHRAKALALVKQAEGELREALDWAKAHPDAKKPASSTPSTK